MVDAVEVHLAGILLRSKRRVREINLTIATHHDVVRRVESLAFETRSQHLDFAVLQRASYPALAKFAAIQAPLGVIRVANGAARALGENLIRSARDYLEEFIHYRVAKQQESVVGPHRPFGKVEIGNDALDLQVAEVLGERAGREQ